jgi:hypothetical protein
VSPASCCVCVGAVVSDLLRLVEYHTLAFFSILIFFNYYFRNEAGETFFFKSDHFNHVVRLTRLIKESHQSNWRD